MPLCSVCETPLGCPASDAPRYRGEPVCDGCHPGGLV